MQAAARSPSCLYVNHGEMAKCTNKHTPDEPRIQLTSCQTESTVEYVIAKSQKAACLEKARRAADLPASTWGIKKRVNQALTMHGKSRTR